MRYPLDRMMIRANQMGVQNPKSNTYGMVRMDKTHRGKAHQGWDLAAAPGTPTYAITYGQVENMPYHLDWGNRVRLKFLYKGQIYYAFYCHLSWSLFTDPAPVVEGMMLGCTGTSGNANQIPTSEAHLHFGISSRPEPRPTGHADHVVDYIDPGEILGYAVYERIYPTLPIMGLGSL